MADSDPGLAIAEQDHIRSEKSDGIAYEHPSEGRIDAFPWDHEILAECKTIYKSFKGWTEELPHGGKISDMSKNAQAYVDGVEEILGFPVSMVGTGVNRQDALFR
ncbi:MAG: adenylosuccinate synthetase [Oligoflexus sp.]|nr:adenylosuccinate synthetase [Oligoflexus sp.]